MPTVPSTASTGIGKATRRFAWHEGLLGSWRVYASLTAGDALLAEACVSSVCQRLTSGPNGISPMPGIAAAAERRAAHGRKWPRSHWGTTPVSPWAVRLSCWRAGAADDGGTFFGQIAVTQALLPALLQVHTSAGAGGRIVAVVLHRWPVTTPYMVPYNARVRLGGGCRAALRVELRRSHVQVTLIEPGSVATPIWDKGNELIDGVEVPEELRRSTAMCPRR